MKKTISLIAIFALLIIALTSCAPRTADALLSRALRKMDGLESFKTVSEAHITYAEGKTTLDIENTSEQIFYGIGSMDDFYHYLSTATVTEKTVANTVTKTEESMVECYVNGNMMLMTESGDRTRKLYSAISTGDYLDFLAVRTEGDGFEFGNANEKSFEKTESGYLAHLIFSDRDNIDDLLPSKDVFASMGYEAVKIEAELTIDEDYRITKITFTPEFKAIENSDGETDSAIGISYSMTLHYSDFNCAEPKTDFITEEGWVEVDDLRGVLQLSDFYEDFADREESAFEITNETKYTLPSTTKKVIQSGKGSHSNKDGFTFKLDADLEVSGVSKAQSYLIEYKNGVMSVNGEDEDMTEADARLTFSELIRNSEFDITRVTNVHVGEDGTVVIELDHKDNKEIEDALKSLGAVFFDEATELIYLTYRDGEIVKIVSEVKARGRMTSGGSLKVDTVSSFEVVPVAGSESDM